MSSTKSKWLWPVVRFWKYTPGRWCAAVLWNVCELMGVAVPKAPTLFGYICGSVRSKRV